MEDNKISVNLLPNEYLILDRENICEKIKKAENNEDIVNLAEVLTGIKRGSFIDKFSKFNINIINAVI